MLWALLFAVFFGLLALGRADLAVPAGWLAIMESVVTTTVPGGLLLVGEWTPFATVLVAAAAVITVAVVAALVVRR